MPKVSPPPQVSPRGERSPKVGVGGFAILRISLLAHKNRSETMYSKASRQPPRGGGIRLTVVCHWLHSGSRDQRKKMQPAY